MAKQPHPSPFAGAFVGLEYDPPVPHGFDDEDDGGSIVGGCMPCEKCGRMWEQELTMEDFARDGWLCSTCSG